MTGSSSKMSDAGSIQTRTSHRTVDKERIRQKAMMLNMKEKLRISICVRIQKQFKKSPAAAQEIADGIMKLIQRNGLSDNLTDAELDAMVKEVSRKDSNRSVSHRQSSSGDKHDPSQQPQQSSSARKSISDEKPSKSSKTPPAASIRLPAENIYMSETQLQQSSIGFVLPAKVSPKKHKQGDIWNEIVHYRSIEEEMEAEAKKKKLLTTRKKWSSELAVQISEKQNRKAHEVEEDERYHEDTMKRIEQVNSIEKQKEKRRVELAKEQNKIQEAQRQYKLQRKEQEREAKRQQELKMAAMIARQKEDEEKREAARKEAEKLKMAIVQKENEEQLQKKKQMKMNEREHEVHLAEQYIAMEEAKDNARKKGLEDMSKRIQAKMKFFDDTSKAETDLKEKEDEMRALRYQEEHRRNEAEKDEKKKAAAALRNQQQQEYLKNQMKEKKLREQRDKMEYNQQAEIWKKERAEAEQRDRAQQQQRAAKNHLQQNLLLQQIQEKEKHLLEADHTALEIQLNQAILAKIPSHSTDAGAAVADETRQRSRELALREKKEEAARVKQSKSKARLSRK